MQNGSSFDEEVKEENGTIWEHVSNIATGKENATKGKSGSKSTHSSKNISKKKQLTPEDLFLRGITHLLVFKREACVESNNYIVSTYDRFIVSG